MSVWRVRRSDMAQTKAWIMGSVPLALLGIAALVFALRAGERDVAFCRRVFTGLAEGRQSVRYQIRWEHLTAMGKDVGAEYAQLPDERARSGYQQAFVAKFADGFRKAGGRVSAFTNWRTETGQDGRAVVIVEYPEKRSTLLFHLAAGGPRNVESIQWK